VEPTDLYGQKRERGEVERMPHTGTAEAAGAHRNRAAKPSATHSRQREREVRVRVEASEREGGHSWLGQAGPV
jgi:anti-sigma factor RsiW